MNYIRLKAEDLTKWDGFSCGNILYEHGFIESLGNRDSDIILFELVRKFLLPAIGRELKLTFVNTTNNPVGLLRMEKLTMHERGIYVDVPYEKIHEMLNKIRN